LQALIEQQLVHVVFSGAHSRQPFRWLL
jgi:hypothetical protein